jgi:NAD(P)-dependent dehydrogenase (short-subunit alcohol dehydrogenase family)
MKSGSIIIQETSINAYISTKEAIILFARDVADQRLGQGFHVNAVCPGLVGMPLVM